MKKTLLLSIAILFSTWALSQDENDHSNIQDTLINYNQAMLSNIICRDCNVTNFKSDYFKKKNSVFFTKDPNSLAAYILWYKCLEQTYFGKIKDLYSDKPYENLTFINKADSILKICESLNDENHYEKYKDFFENPFNGFKSRERVQNYISNSRNFINLNKEYLEKKIKDIANTKIIAQKAIDDNRDKWAIYETNLIPLSADFAAEGSRAVKMPLELGNYENKNNDTYMAYDKYSQTNYCTEYVTVESTSIGNKAFKYVIGEIVNKTRYKRDTDVFVAKIDAEEKDLTKKIIWLKTFDNQNADGHTFDFGKTLCLTKDGGCVVTFIVEDEGNVFLKLDKTGNEVWRKWRPQPADWIEANRAHNYQVFSPEAMLEDKDGNVLTFFSTGGTSDFVFLKLNSTNGKILWEKRFVKDLKFSIYQGLFGSIIEIPNQGYILLLNFDKITDQFGNEFKSRAIGQYNIAALKLDYSLLYTSLYPFISDEPRYVNSCELTKENTIKCYGRRGNYHEAGDPMNYNLRKNLQYSWPDTKNGNNSFFMEIDLSGKILKTNGME